MMAEAIGGVISTAVVGGILLLAVILVLRGMWRKRKQGGCGCGCSGCSINCGKKSQDKDQ